jgi:23S rRNA (uracil1939-C5)-methyltransferase
MDVLTVESLDQEGRGVAHRDGKAIFIEGALPGETVRYAVSRRKPNYEIAAAVEVLRQSSSRVAPRCHYFGRCGGCSLQHLEPRAQLAVKQRVLEDDLWHIGRVRPGVVLPAIYGPSWGYRHRARLTVRYVPKKGGALVGFHERRSSYVADMRSCEILPPRISELLPPLRALIDGLSIRARLPQIEVALGDGCDVLVFRVLARPSAPDEELLRAFAERHAVSVYLQPGGPESSRAFHPSREADLYYGLPEFDLRIGFSPTDFTQVNHAVNRVLVRRALALLEVKPGERVADLFCGLGNFTLAIARSGAHATGIEGNGELIRRAEANAARNGLTEAARFVEMDLYAEGGLHLPEAGHFDRMLVDPPRDGAIEVVKALSEDGPRRIVYISCNPATLARDAAVLVHSRGYALAAAGVVNMFPHTSHVESIAVFDR